MKPILIILLPIEAMKEKGADLNKALRGVENDYHVLVATTKNEDIGFKLLNGIEENYNQLSEFKEQIKGLIYETS